MPRVTVAANLLLLQPNSSIKRDAYGYTRYARSLDQQRYVAGLGVQLEAPSVERQRPSGKQPLAAFAALAAVGKLGARHAIPGVAARADDEERAGHFRTTNCLWSRRRQLAGQDGEQAQEPFVEQKLPARRPAPGHAARPRRLTWRRRGGERTVFKKGRQAGLAQIVARQTHEGEYRRGLNLYPPTGLYHHVYDYVADVTPDDETAVFRATFTELFKGDNDRRPLVGEQARVTFDAKHEQVEFGPRVGGPKKLGGRPRGRRWDTW